MKKFTKAICVLLSICLFSGCSLVLTNPVDTVPEKEEKEVTGTVLVTVEALGETLYEGEVSLNEGMSALDATLLFAEQEEIEIVYKNAYIQKIGDYREKDHGPMSGWLYYVNGESAMVGCSDYILSDKDEILWKYVKDFSEEY